MSRSDCICYCNLAFWWGNLPDFCIKYLLLKSFLDCHWNWRIRKGVNRRLPLSDDDFQSMIKTQHLLSSRKLRFLNVFFFKARPNEFGFMTARKDYSSPIKSIFCHKEKITRPCKAVQFHELPYTTMQDH